jgi:hypothetical protein
MAEKRTQSTPPGPARTQWPVGGLALIFTGAALLALISAVQVEMGWQRVDRVVKQGLEQSATLSGLE